MGNVQITWKIHPIFEFLAYKYDALEFDELTKDMEDFVKDQKDKLLLALLRMNTRLILITTKKG